MANSYISKVKLPNDNNTYLIKDDEARETLLQLQNNFVSKDGDTIDGTLNVTDVNAGTLLVTGNASFVNGLHGDLDGNATTATTAATATEANHAASATTATSATSAGKIQINNTDANVGDYLTPTYFLDGVPTQSAGKTIPLINGTGTTAGTWLGSLTGLTAYSDGLLILYKIPIAGASTTTLNINSIGAKTVYWNNASKLTTHFPVNQIIMLVYCASLNSGSWVCIDTYNGDTDHYTTPWCNTSAGTAAKVATCNGYVLRQNQVFPVLMATTNTSQSLLTLNINGTGAKNIYINGDVSSASNYTLPAGIYFVYYNGTNYYFNTDNIIDINISGNAATATFATEATKLVPIQTMTYTGILGTADNSADSDSFYFMRMRPTTFYDQWMLHYRVTAFIPNQTNYRTTSDVILYGYGQASVPAMKIFNTIYSTSYRPIYYNNFYRLNSTGYNGNCYNAVGVGLNGSNSRNSAGYERTIVVELLETYNCTAELLNSAVKWANWESASSNYAGISQFDAYTNGLQETGDNNDVTTQRFQYSHLTAGKNGIKMYSLVMMDSSGKWQSFTTGSGGTATTKAKNTTGFVPGMIYYVSRNSDVAPDGVTADNQLYRHINLVDLRYSTNCGQTLTANKMVYIVGTMSDGLFYLDNTWWTQTEPTEADGKVYIPIGITYDKYRADLLNWQGMYYHNGTNFVPYYEATASSHATSSDLLEFQSTISTNASQVGNAGTITGLTVSKIGSISDFATTDVYAPASNAGMLLNMGYSDTYGHQVFVDDSSNLLMHRYNNNGTWQNWQQILDTSTFPISIENGGTNATTIQDAANNLQVVSLGQGIPITTTQNTNIDNIVAIGNYYCSSNSYVSSLGGTLPSGLGNNAFTLKVGYSTGTGSKYQELRQYSNGRTWYRVKGSNSDSANWGSWNPYYQLSSIALTGDTTGTATSNVGAWSIATSTKKLTTTGRLASANIESTSQSGKMTYILASASMTTGKPPVMSGSNSSDGYILNFAWDNGGWAAQFYLRHDKTNPNPMVRGAVDKNVDGVRTSEWGDWKHILTEENYSDYTVTKTGGGASGDWNINAATATSATTATKATKDSDGNDINTTYLKLTGGVMKSGNIIMPETGWIKFPDSGNWGRSNEGVTFPVARGGIEWRGQSDYIQIFGEETSNDNLNLVMKFGDDVSPSLSFRDKNNAEVASINAGGVITATSFVGSLTGNATTATKFSSTRKIELTGDVTGLDTKDGSSGWSITTTLANSGVTSGSYGQNADASPAHSGTFNVPYFTVDEKGRITSASTKTITLPADSDTKYNVYDKIIDANFATNYRTQTKGNTNSGWYISAIRNNTANVANSPQHGSGLGWGVSDTHGYLYTDYRANNPGVYVGGGNANKLNWIKALAFADGTNASGTWGISITGNANTATSATSAGSATTATKFSSDRTIALTGDVTGTASSDGSDGWSIATSIGNTKVTNAMLAGSIANDKLANSSITIAGQSVSLGGSITLAQMGLSGAMHFLGISSTAITNNGTENPKIGSTTISSKTSGDVVIYGGEEFVWNGSKWQLLGQDGSFKVVQTAVSDPTASGSTSQFISSISQDANGVITVSKKNLPTITLTGDTTGTITPSTALTELSMVTQTKRIHYLGRLTSANLDFSSNNYKSKLTYMLASSSMTDGKPPSDSGVLNFAWDNNKWGSQLAIRMTSTPHIYIRGNNNVSWDAEWLTVLDSNNYTTYTVTKTGTGASGDWGINITGNATTATTATTASKATAADISTTANSLAYYIDANGEFGHTGSYVKYLNHIAASVYGYVDGLEITGDAYGEADRLVSGTAGQMSYGDCGPQIRFSSGGQKGAMIFNHYDSSSGMGTSFNFVTNQTNIAVKADGLIARTRAMIGGNSVNSNYVLYANGATYINGATNITGTLTLSKTTDLSGTANNSPALIVGGAVTAAHIEIDSDEIQAKTNGTTCGDIYINNDGGAIHLGSSVEVSDGTVTATTFTGTLSGLKITTTTNIGIDETDVNQAIGYVSGLTSATWNNQQTIGALYRQVYSADQIHQIFGDYSTGHIAVRGRKNSTWGNWHSVLDDDNWSNVITKSALGLGKVENKSVATIKNEILTSSNILSALEIENGVKPLQTTVSSPTANGNSLSYIDTISQNTYGVISATKKTIPEATTSQAGIIGTGTQTFAGIKKFTSDLYITKTTTIANNSAAKLVFQVTQSDNNITTASEIAVYDDHDDKGYGTNMVIRSNGNVIIGSGESPIYFYNDIISQETNAAEIMYLTSDTSIRFLTNYKLSNGATASYSEVILNTNRQFYPGDTNTGYIGTSTNQWNHVYAVNLHGAWYSRGRFGNSTTKQSLNDIDCLTDEYKNKIVYFLADGNTLYKPGSNASGANGHTGHVLNFGWDNGTTNHYGSQLLIDQAEIFIRGSDNTDSRWGDWITILNSSNWSTVVTKSAIGLGNVENKSVATIKSEILTSANIISALGYTPLETVTAKIFAGSGTAANATTTNGYTKITVASNGTVQSNNGYITIKGTGATSVTSEGGVITVNSEDTHNTAYLYAGASNGSANAATTSGNTHLILKDGSSVSSRVKIAGDGATSVVSDANGTITISSTNTWTPMTGATSSANGTVGYVNAIPPKNGYNTKYLRADGTWVVPPNDNTWTAMVGATSSANGSVGYVNAVPPKDGYNTKYLRADGSWAVPPNDNTWTAMVGATSSANGSVGYVNAIPPKDGYNTKYLRADGTWTVPPDTWREIADNLTSSTATTTSLSAKQGYLLANGSARDNTKLPLAGGTLTGALTGTTISATSVSVSSYVSVNSGNSSTSGGLALYGNTPTNYGIAMRGTGNGGKHGYVQGDWGIYSYMTGAANNIAGRGWVLRDALNNANVASVNTQGNAVFNGSVTVGGNTTNTSGVQLEYSDAYNCLNFVFN